MFISTFVIVVITVLNIIVYYLRQHQEEDYGERENSSLLSSDQLCCRFSLAEIKSVTHNFDEALVIGKGGFGKVYKGIIEPGASTVAIKRLDLGSNQGAPEFWTEIEMLSKFRHSHLVSLIGYCEAGQEMILVYKYMPGGTLEDHLHKIRRSNGSNSPLSWVQRLNICIGAARGLDYLHTGTDVQQRVIHGDVKSSNILLDENLAAKISDFGLSRSGPVMNQACTTRVYTDHIRGTFGYMDVEYFLTHRLTRKSDVYAFGVVLFEVLCGRPAVDLRLDEEQHSLAGWAKRSIREGTIDQIIDPCLRGQLLPSCLKEFVQIADKCLLNSPKDRPTMAEVVVRLELALALQERINSSVLEGDLANTGEAYDNQGRTDSFSEEEASSTSEDGGDSSTGQEAISASDGGGHHEEQIEGYRRSDGASRTQYHVKHARKLTFLRKVQSLFSAKAPAVSVVGGDKSLESGQFDFDTIKVATNNFSEANKLEQGGNGSVYKAPQVSSFLGKAGNVGLEVLDTLGSSMSNLNANSGFVSNMASRGNKVVILAFEVANTIVKGSNLMQSLSEENIQILKKEILHSEGVQQLVSTDMKELLSIAVADKREEFDVFSREVIRFGDLCKDPQWHNLGRFFSRLDLDPATNKQLKEEAEITMQELTTLAQHTSELYHEYHALDRFEQDYQRKLEEVESLHLPRKRESLMILQSELKHQRKLVRSLKKKSLWSKSVEEVVEKLDDVVTFIHQAILDAFGENGSTLLGKEAINKKSERLGVAGLALHYANLITQMDNIASRPTSLPPNMRDTLYNGLPGSVKTALRSRLQTVNSKEVMTMPQIKAEMEKTLQWLVPVATDTTKAHQGFGWVGEWANTGNEFGKKTGANSNLIRLQTLYHADKQKMDLFILDLVTWLHRLISLVRYRDNCPKYTPVRSPPSHNGLILHSELHVNNHSRLQTVQLSSEDKILLEEVMKRRRLVPGKSKSQELVIVNKRRRKVWAFSRSTGSSPRRELEYANANMLDVLDGLDTTF